MAVLVAVQFVISNYSMQRNASVTVDTSIANEDVKQAIATRPYQNNQAGRQAVSQASSIQLDHGSRHGPR